MLTSISLKPQVQTIQQIATASADEVERSHGTDKIVSPYDLISLDQTRIITSVIKPGGYELTAWEVSADAITKKGSKLLLAANIEGIHSVKLTNTRFANAYILNHQLALEVWDTSTDGANFTLKGNATGNRVRIESSSKQYAFIALSPSSVISFSIDPEQQLEVISWRISGNGAITRKDTKIFGKNVDRFIDAIALNSSKFILSFYSGGGGNDSNLSVWEVNDEGMLIPVEPLEPGEHQFHQ